MDDIYAPDKKVLRLKTKNKAYRSKIKEVIRGKIDEMIIKKIDRVNERMG